jgi:hypothetical protein
MKLLHCTACGDLVRLYAEPRRCHCGKSVGRYVSDLHVALAGPCRALGLDTREVQRGDAGAWRVSARAVVDPIQANASGACTVVRGEAGAPDDAALYLRATRLARHLHGHLPAGAFSLGVGAGELVLYLLVRGLFRDAVPRVFEGVPVRVVHAAQVRP